MGWTVEKRSSTLRGRINKPPEKFVDQHGMWFENGELIAEYSLFALRCRSLSCEIIVTLIVLVLLSLLGDGD